MKVREGRGKVLSISKYNVNSLLSKVVNIFFYNLIISVKCRGIFH